MQVQGALLGAPTPVTLLEVELAGCLDLLPCTASIEGHLRLNRRLDLQTAVWGGGTVQYSRGLSKNNHVHGMCRVICSTNSC
jgi:hypothetical protein